MIKYILFFFLFGVVGWVVDSCYRSLVEKKWTTGTHFLFFSPIYAFGGTSLVLIYTFLNVNIVFQILFAGPVLMLVELLSGIFCENVINKRYWDYSKNKWNFMGHIDALHSFYWFVLAIIVRMLFPVVGLLLLPRI